MTIGGDVKVYSAKTGRLIRIIPAEKVLKYDDCPKIRTAHNGEHKFGGKHGHTN